MTETDVTLIGSVQKIRSKMFRYTIATSHEHVNGGTKMCSIVAWRRFQITWIHLGFHSCTRFQGCYIGSMQPLGIKALATHVHAYCIPYSRKVWQIWQIISNSPN